MKNVYGDIIGRNNATWNKWPIFASQTSVTKSENMSVISPYPTNWVKTIIVPIERSELVQNSPRADTG